MQRYHNDDSKSSRHILNSDQHQSLTVTSLNRQRLEARAASGKSILHSLLEYSVYRLPHPEQFSSPPSLPSFATSLFPHTRLTPSLLLSHHISYALWAACNSLLALGSNRLTLANVQVQLLGGSVLSISVGEICLGAGTGVAAT